MKRFILITLGIVGAAQPLLAASASIEMPDLSRSLGIYAHNLARTAHSLSMHRFEPIVPRTEVRIRRIIASVGTPATATETMLHITENGCVRSRFDGAETPILNVQQLFSMSPMRETLQRLLDDIPIPMEVDPTPMDID